MRDYPDACNVANTSGSLVNDTINTVLDIYQLFEAAVKSHSTILFYLDFISPFSYLANVKLPELAARYRAELVYLPLDVMRAKLAIGNFAPSTRAMPGKRNFILRDRLWWAQQHGVSMQTPPAFSAPRLNAGMLYAQECGCVRNYVDTAFHHVWGLGGDPDDDELLAAVVRQTGLDPEAYFSYVNAVETRERVAAIAGDAASRGVFGVPTMIVGDEMFWGNDRLDFLEECLESNTQETNDVS
ncbi:MAG: 2-hydroxychromene-2-carboxylate isomerase [Pigmentiphaga sp.]|uniref:2-hydroxychromene-2-carboxylate isomerase n=1 Tax=Pigmentiphaga sp. TaxID=1977564 RepID=UPI003B56BD75